MFTEGQTLSSVCSEISFLKGDCFFFILKTASEKAISFFFSQDIELSKTKKTNKQTNKVYDTDYE